MNLTLDPGRLFSDQCIAHVLGHASVGTSGEDPGARGLGSLQKAFAETSLQFGLDVKVGLASVDRDEEFRLLQAPFAQQEGQDELWTCVIRQSDVLRRRERRHNKQRINFCRPFKVSKLSVG